MTFQMRELPLNVARAVCLCGRTGTGDVDACSRSCTHVYVIVHAHVFVFSQMRMCVGVTQHVFTLTCRRVECRIVSWNISLDVPRATKHVGP